jgi:hypothetical protein
VESDVTKDDEESDERSNEGDADVGGIGNGTLDGREDGTTSDTHDKDTGTAAGVDTEVGSSHGEDSRIHWGHEEVDGHDGTDGTLALAGTDVGVKSNAGNGVEDHDEAGAQDGGKTSGDEATDGEGDQSVGEEVGSLRLSPASVVDSVVDEESTNGNLGTNVAELSKETEEHVVLLPDAALTNLAALDIVLGLDERIVALSLLSNLGELGEDEQDGNGNTEAGNSKVDELDVGKVVSVLAGSPMTTAYELAAVSRVARPQAITRVQAQKPPKEAEALAFDEKWAVGQNITAPMEYRERPMRIQIL